jgi:hypothetical protein
MEPYTLIFELHLLHTVYAEVRENIVTLTAMFSLRSIMHQKNKNQNLALSSSFRNVSNPFRSARTSVPN